MKGNHQQESYQAQGADYSGQNMQRHSFRLGKCSAIFCGANLAWSEFDTVLLQDADFSSADLTGVSFKESTLLDVNFSRAILVGATFTGAHYLSGVNFSGAILIGTKGLSEGELQEAASKGAITTGKALFEALQNGDVFVEEAYQAITAALWVEAETDRGRVNTHIGMENHGYMGQIRRYLEALSHDKQPHAMQRGREIEALSKESKLVTMPSTPLASVVFDRCNLAGADFSSAYLLGASFQDANLERSCLKKAYAVYANFEGAMLTKADFQGSILSYANFRNATLVEANLCEADLTGACNVDNADFSKANFTGADLTGASLLEVKLTGSILLGVTGLFKTVLKKAEEAGAITTCEALVDAWQKGSVSPEAAYQSAKVLTHLVTREMDDATKNLYSETAKTLMLGLSQLSDDKLPALWDSDNFHENYRLRAAHGCIGKSEHFSLLPNELKEYIVGSLSGDDLKNAGSVSKPDFGNGSKFTPLLKKPAYEKIVEERKLTETSMKNFAEGITPHTSRKKEKIQGEEKYYLPNEGKKSRCSIC